MKDLLDGEPSQRCLALYDQPCIVRVPRLPLWHGVLPNSEDRRVNDLRGNNGAWETVLMKLVNLLGLNSAIVAENGTNKGLDNVEIYFSLMYRKSRDTQSKGWYDRYTVTPQTQPLPI